MKPIQYSKPFLGREEAEAAFMAVLSGWVSRGPRIREFEDLLTGYCGARHAVSASSGTAALHLAALAVGLGPGKRFWTTPMSFVATANCGLYAGAALDFVDIDPATANMDLGILEKKLEKADKENSLPHALVVVHFAGQSCDMARLADLSARYGFRVIEDASHCLGGSYRDEKIGCCSYSDVCVLSFHALKSITTGEGGAILTNDGELYDRLVKLRHNGITKDPKKMQENHGPWYYEQHDLGFNYWLSDIHCAVGIEQMARLDAMIAKRAALAGLYTELLQGLPLTPLSLRQDCESGWHLYVIRLELEKIALTRRQVFESLLEKGIGVQVHYIPIPVHPYYRDLGFNPEDYPRTMSYYEGAISLPLHPGLEEEDVRRVAGVLGEMLGEVQA